MSSSWGEKWLVGHSTEHNDDKKKINLKIKTKNYQKVQYLKKQQHIDVLLFIYCILIKLILLPVIFCQGFFLLALNISAGVKTFKA